MTLSRTLRILLALLLLSAAAFVWFNSLEQSGSVMNVPADAGTPRNGVAGVTPPPSPTPATNPGEVEAADAARTMDAAEAMDATTLPASPVDTEAETVNAPRRAPDTEAISESHGAPEEPGTEAASSRPTSVTVAPPVTEASATPTTRPLGDVEVLTLPLLPESEAEMPEEAADVGTSDQNAVHTFNPFAPVGTTLGIAPEEPDGEPSDVPLAAIPVPTAVLPTATVRTRTLTPLPSGTLRSTPDLLRDRRADPGVAPPSNLANRAILTVPTPTGLVPSSPRTAAPGRTLGTTLVPLPPGAIAPGVAPPSNLANRAILSVPTPTGFATSSTRTAAPGSPLGTTLVPLPPGAVAPDDTAEAERSLGNDPVARYLQERNVRFTGVVTGSIGVGVFRSSDASNPIVLALGQTLPDSDITLTQIGGQTAAFTLGDTTHVLTLDLRR